MTTAWVTTRPPRTFGCFPPPGASPVVQTGDVAETVFGGDNRAYAKMIDAAVDALQEDILDDRCRPDIVRCHGTTGGQHVSNKFVTDWVRWIQDWRAYYNDHVNICSVEDGSIGCLFYERRDGPMRAQLDQWKGQLDGWEREAVAAGVPRNTPHLDAPPDDSIPWTWIVVGAIAVSVAVVVRSVV